MSSDLIKGLSGLRNQVSDLFKAKRDKSMENDLAAQWLAAQEAKASKPSAPILSRQEYIDKGHSPNEADVLTGMWRPKLAGDNREDLNSLTPAMLEHLKGHAAKYLADYDKQEAARANPEFNPVKSAHGKLLTSADKAYSPLENAKKQFMESPEYTKHTDEFDKEDALNEFTSRWLKDPKNKDKAAGIHSLANIASEKHANMAASLERRADQMRDIASGGVAGALDPVKASAADWHSDDEEPNDIKSAYQEEMEDKSRSASSISSASQHLGLSGKAEEGEVAQAQQQQPSRFASSNKEFVNEKVKPAADRLTNAAASKRQSWQKHLEAKNPEAIARKNAIDSHKNNITKKPKGEG